MSSFHERFHEGGSEVLHGGNAERYAQVNVVPPVGFEPTPPPPETGRPRGRGRPRVSYLGFLFAFCVSGALLCAVVRSTRHSTANVHLGRSEALVLERSG
jgi:hypothetical protein